MLDKFNDFNVTGFVTSDNLKFLLLHKQRSEESIRRGQYSPAKRTSWLDLLGRIRRSFSDIAPEQTRSGFVCEYSASEYNVHTSMPDPFPDQEED